MISLENISFSYNEQSFIKDVSLSFERGKLYSIIGPNGCGKTTLVNLISRYLKAQNGNMFIEGKKYEDYARKEFAKKLSVLSQGASVPNMAVGDFVSYGRFPYLNISRTLTKQDNDAIQDAFTKTNTEQFKNRNIAELSGGERQRVYIAMLLSQNTPYNVVDEPTTYLDISNQFLIMNMLTDMKSEGKCVISVLHELTLALSFSDEIIVMNNGKIVSIDSPENSVQNGIIDKVFNVCCNEVSVNGKKEFIITPR